MLLSPDSHVAVQQLSSQGLCVQWKTRSTSWPNNDKRCPGPPYQRGSGNFAADKSCASASLWIYIPQFLSELCGNRWLAALFSDTAQIHFDGPEPWDGAALKKRYLKGVWVDTIAKIYEIAEFISRTIKDYRAEWEEGEDLWSETWNSFTAGSLLSLLLLLL